MSVSEDVRCNPVARMVHSESFFHQRSSLCLPSVVDAVECAVAVQSVMAQRNEGIPQDRRMLFRIGVNLGDLLIEG